MTLILKDRLNTQKTPHLKYTHLQTEISAIFREAISDIESFDRFAIQFVSFSLNSFVPDARFFAFSSTEYPNREEAANFWQVWYNTTFTSEDYGSFFVTNHEDSRVTPTVGVSLITDSRQTVEESAATPTYVQTSRTSSGKNIIFNQIKLSKSRTVSSQ